MHISVDVHCVASSCVCVCACGMVPCTSGMVVGKGLRLPHVNVHNICNSASGHLTVHLCFQLPSGVMTSLLLILIPQVALRISASFKMQ